MHINEDFEELLLLLNREKVKYLIVGAYAVIFHTEPRYTKDIDIWIKPEHENAERVYRVLKKFGAPLGRLTLNDLVNPKMVYQIGVEPNRIDILMGIGSIDFDTAWKNRKTDRYGRAKIFILGRRHLIKAKSIAGRPGDLRDLEVLRKNRKN